MSKLDPISKKNTESSFPQKDLKELNQSLVDKSKLKNAIAQNITEKLYYQSQASIFQQILQSAKYDIDNAQRSSGNFLEQMEKKQQNVFISNKTREALKQKFEKDIQEQIFYGMRTQELERNRQEYLAQRLISKRKQNLQSNNQNVSVEQYGRDFKALKEGKMKQNFSNKYEVKEYSWDLFKDNNEVIKKSLKSGSQDSKQPERDLMKWKKYFHEIENSPDLKQKYKKHSPFDDLNMTAKELESYILTQKRSPTLDLIDFAYQKINLDETKTHKMLSQFEKNRLALSFLKLNDGIQQHSKIAKEPKNQGRSNNPSILAGRRATINHKNQQETSQIQQNIQKQHNPNISNTNIIDNRLSVIQENIPINLPIARKSSNRIQLIKILNDQKQIQEGLVFSGQQQKGHTSKASIDSLHQSSLISISNQNEHGNSLIVEQSSIPNENQIASDQDINFSQVLKNRLKNQKIQSKRINMNQSALYKSQEYQNSLVQSTKFTQHSQSQIAKSFDQTSQNKSSPSKFDNSSQKVIIQSQIKDLTNQCKDVLQESNMDNKQIQEMYRNVYLEQLMRINLAKQKQREQNRNSENMYQTTTSGGQQFSSIQDYENIDNTQMLTKRNKSYYNSKISLFEKGGGSSLSKVNLNNRYENIQNYPTAIQDYDLYQYQMNQNTKKKQSNKRKQYNSIDNINQDLAEMKSPPISPLNSQKLNSSRNNNKLAYSFKGVPPYMNGDKQSKTSTLETIEQKYDLEYSNNQQEATLIKLSNTKLDKLKIIPSVRSSLNNFSPSINLKMKINLKNQQPYQDQLNNDVNEKSRNLSQNSMQGTQKSINKQLEQYHKLNTYSSQKQNQISNYENLEKLVDKSINKLDKAMIKFDERVLQNNGPNLRSITDQSSKNKDLLVKSKHRQKQQLVEYYQDLDFGMKFIS